MSAAMRIGEVHAILRREFPELELSTIRYYEDKDLVRPARSKKGYRLFSDRDLACLREAIRLAKQEFVPLRVVRLRLIQQGLLDGPVLSSAPKRAAREAPVHAVRAAAPPAAGGSSTKAAAPAEVEGGATHSLSELAEATGLDAATVLELLDLGILEPQMAGGEHVFRDGEVEIARVAASLVSLGAPIRRLAALRRLAEREVGVIEELTAAWREPGRDVDGDLVRVTVDQVVLQAERLRALLFARLTSAVGVTGAGTPGPSDV